MIPAEGQFAMVLWQANPLPGSNGLLLRDDNFNAGKYTGFYSGGKLGFNPSATETSEVEMFGTTVGAYLNSADIAGGNAGGDNRSKFMMTPTYTFPQVPGPGQSGQEPIFQNLSSGLQVQLELQVPTAESVGGAKCSTYASVDALFVQKDNNRFQVTYAVGLYSSNYGNNSPPINGAMDPYGADFIIETRLDSESSDYVTLNNGTTTDQNQPWLGFKKFSYTVTRENFKNALIAVGGAYKGSQDPSDYVLKSIHLNAEMQFAGCANGAPVRLGWSMENLVVNWLNNLTP